MSKRNRNRVLTVDDLNTNDINVRTIDAPVAEDQDTDAPVAEDQDTDAPVAEDQDTDAPVAEDQDTDAPVAENQDTDAPVAKVKTSKPKTDSDMDGPEYDYSSALKFNDSQFEWLPWESIYADLDFNVREHNNYTRENLATLIESLRLIGLQSPLVVSRQRDGRNKVLRGHRRLTAMGFAREDFLALVNDGKADLVDMPFRIVKCDVKYNMSLADEITMMIDHGNRKGLNATELFNAVEKLRGLNWSETAIRNHLTMERGKVTTHFKAASLPKNVRDMYRTYLDKNTRDKVPFLGKEAIEGLYSAQKKDRNSGKVRFGGGPEFLKKWEEVKSKPKTVNRSSSVATKVGNLLDRYNQDHPLLVNFLNHLMGNAEGLPKFDDVMFDILHAFHSTFPVEQPEVTKVIEGNVTKDLS